MNGTMPTMALRAGAIVPARDHSKNSCKRRDATFRLQRANVQIVTRSGSKDFHGVVYRTGMTRSTRTILFCRGGREPTGNQAQCLGGTLVVLKKDKAFFFVSLSGTAKAAARQSSTVCLPVFW
jgi:hypothetical protein